MLLAGLLPREQGCNTDKFGGEAKKSSWKQHEKFAQVAQLAERPEQTQQAKDRERAQI